MEEYDKLKNEILDAAANLKQLEEKVRLREAKLEKAEQGVIQLAKERQIGFPWLAKAYEEYLELLDKSLVDFLKYKSHAAISASEVVKQQSEIRRKAIKDKKVAEYLVAYYENIAPFLIDLKEEVDIQPEEERVFLNEYSAEELEDATTNYLTKEEYRKLPSVTRNQTALDRYWKRPKSKWLLGRMYERYVGYLFEQQGYKVEYVGIFKGYEDLGRDLICKKGNEIIVIQCKYWSQFRTIYEKHIFQFFGTLFQYKDENPGFNVKGIFYTSTKLSDLARRFATALNVSLEENFKFDQNYPVIKCNINKSTGEKIYHLPFDQQYDKAKIETNNGEFYCITVKEAEEKGFRRAYRWKKPTSL